MNEITKLQNRLESRANPNTKIWWENYLKHVIPFRGVKMAHIRTELHHWLKQEAIQTELSGESQKDLALKLIEQSYCEDKLAGILFFQEVLLPANAINWTQDLPYFAALFQQGYIYDWSTCDWFCVRILGPLAQREGELCARSISNWCQSDNLWQRRAAGVAFVNLAKKGDANFKGFSDMIIETCAATVQYQERFAQTGTGWVLRELSHAEPKRVIEFVEKNVVCFSREGLSYAIAKLPVETKIRLKKLHKTQQDTVRVKATPSPA